MDVKPLSEHDLQVDDVSPAQGRGEVLRAPPLRYYVLCVEAGPSSYLHSKPRAEAHASPAARGTFTMSDLVRFTLRDD